MQNAGSSTQSMTLGDRLAQQVLRHRVGIIVFWLTLAIVSRAFAPDWKSIAFDGDFDYLPASSPTVAGERVLDAAFPTQRSRSQIVLLFTRQHAELDQADELVALDLLRRLHHRLAEVSLAKLDRHRESLGTARKATLLNDAKTFLDEAIRLDQLYFESVAALQLDNVIAPEQIRIALAYWDRANVLQQLEQAEQAAVDTQVALILVPDMAASAPQIPQRDLAAWMQVIDIHSWKDAIVGSQLTSPDARLAILMSDAELAATSNIEFFNAVTRLKDDVLRRHAAFIRPGIDLFVTGSAAIGGETLSAARDAIRYTELLTVLLILGILTFVYRAPLLVAIPILSIAIAVIVSSGLVGWLTLLSQWVQSPLFDFRVFTTSRIFVVVILFGVGTDFCLFLISRLREEAAKWPWEIACQRSLAGVSGAIFGSALTTIVGLAMLAIAEFGKFSYTGPVIALCLMIGLLVSLTFTPAVLSLIGPKAFWPSTPYSAETQGVVGLSARERAAASGVWPLIALKLTRHPGLALVLGLGFLLPPAVLGYLRESEVTFDISSQLNEAAQSRQGLKALDQHFSLGHVNPTTVLLTLPQPIEAAKLQANAKQLAQDLYKQAGVKAVRSADDPLGDFPPDRSMSLLSAEAWRRRALKTHRIARNHFFSESPEYANRLARLDVVIDGDPFAIETADKVNALRNWLEAQTQTAGSPWHQAQIYLTGTTPSIIDLRNVTLADNWRIKIAVVIAVFIALWIVIRRVSLCGYLIATVLLSYYATLGLTILFFRLMYGDGYVGLDWKLPLFLFVILVAVGQDYNVYLVTRILEEQRERGWLSAVRHAVARTGGIITACGLVMAATFFSMTASAWLPWFAGLWTGTPPANHATLRGVVELGFALGLGVLIDTFYVRTILVPSFVTLTDRLRSQPRLPSFPDDSDHGTDGAGR